MLLISLLKLSSEAHKNNHNVSDRRSAQTMLSTIDYNQYKMLIKEQVTIENTTTVTFLYLYRDNKMWVFSSSQMPLEEHHMDETTLGYSRDALATCDFHFYSMQTDFHHHQIKVIKMIWFNTELPLHAFLEWSINTI